jgi:beta-phosphoglucomutase-like phosphatase (HAD superfamily)
MGRLNLDNPVRPLACVDLNGVLDAYTGWKHEDHWDVPRPGAREFLEQLRAAGFDVVVFTTRHPVGVRRWLREHGLLDAVAAVTRRKPPAHVFIDDRAICFNGDFGEALRQAVAFKAHWE